MRWALVAAAAAAALLLLLLRRKKDGFYAGFGSGAFSWRPSCFSPNLAERAACRGLTSGVPPSIEEDGAVTRGQCCGWFGIPPSPSWTSPY